MSTNPFRGFGAINQSPTYAASAKPKMATLGKQYIDNTNGVWPNSNQSLLMVMTHAGAPYITQYTLLKDGSIQDRSANSVSLSIPSTCNAVEFSPEGDYISFAHNGTPYITIAKRKEDGITFTQLTDPATLPTGIGHAVSWNTNADGSYLAISHSTTPFITIYKRSGDTFTKLTNPATLPTGTAWGTSFSPDGTYLAVAHGTTPFVTIYKRSGDTFTKLSDPATLPASTCNGVDWSPDGTYLALAHGTTPFVTIYKRSGDTFTKVTNPSTLPASTGNAVRFSNVFPGGSGYYMAVAHNTTPYCTLYRVDPSTDTWVNLSLVSGLAILPTGTGQSLAFTEDCGVLYIGHTTNPYWTAVGLTYTGFGDSFTVYGYFDLQLPPASIVGVDILYSP